MICGHNLTYILALKNGHANFTACPLLFVFLFWIFDNPTEDEDEPCLQLKNMPSRYVYKAPSCCMKIFLQTCIHVKNVKINTRQDFTVTL